MSTSGLHVHHTFHTHYRLTHVYTIYTSHTHTHTHVYSHIQQPPIYPFIQLSYSVILRPIIHSYILYIHILNI